MACQWVGVPITMASMDGSSSRRRKSVSGLGRFPLNLFGLLELFLEDARVHVADVGDLHVLQFGESVEQASAPPADTHAGDAKLLIGTLGILPECRDRQRRARQCGGLEERTTVGLGHLNLHGRGPCGRFSNSICVPSGMDRSGVPVKNERESGMPAVRFPRSRTGTPGGDCSSPSSSRLPKRRLEILLPRIPLIFRQIAPAHGQWGRLPAIDTASGHSYAGTQ